MPGRPLRIGAFAVAGDRLLIVDEVLPLLVEADADSGAVRRVHTWPVDPAHRGRPAGTDVAVVGDTVVVASSAAGGLVRVDLAASEHQVVGLDAPAGWVATDGSLVLVVADPDWDEDHDGDEAGDGGDEDGLLLPRPVWRLDGTAAIPLDLGGDVQALVVVDGVALGVVRRPGDPIVETARPWGGASFSYPGVIVRWAPATGMTVGAEVTDTAGEIVVDGGRIWLLGFSADGVPVRQLDPRRLVLAPPLPATTGEPIGVTAGVLIELTERRAAAHRGPITGCRVVRRPTAAGGGALGPVDLPAVDPAGQAVDGAIWFRAEAGPELVCVDATGAVHEARRVRVDLDCRPYRPLATVPEGLDVEQFEADQLDQLRKALTGEWVDDDGAQRPFIDGIVFTSVDLRGTFPTTAVVTLFRADSHPGVLFGRRWNLYDELGNPRDLEYADIHLIEDIEAAGRGLPPADTCLPDTDGITWF